MTTEEEAFFEIINAYAKLCHPIRVNARNLNPCLKLCNKFQLRFSSFSNRIIDDKRKSFNIPSVELYEKINGALMNVAHYSTDGFVKYNKRYQIETPTDFYILIKSKTTITRILTKLQERIIKMI